MRPSTRILSLLAVTSWIAAGCSSSESSSDATPVTTAAAATTVAPATIGPVSVTTDVRFAADSPSLSAWSEPLLDVYSSEGAAGLPLVVILPAHDLLKDNPSTVQLATAVAELGAVAVVANWTPLDDPPGTFDDPAVISEVAHTGDSFAGCAVSFAVSQAATYGADPSRVVLVGELFGANIASTIAFAAPAPYPGCASSTAWHATAFVGIDDDWFATAPFFDTVAAAAIETLSPWALLDQATDVSVDLVVTADAPALTGRCDDPNADWMASRDPTGAIREQFVAAGVMADGCIDLGDEATAMAAAMTGHGIHAEVVVLPNTDGATRSDEGAHVLEFGATDLVLLADTIVATVGDS